ncbi:hypothetical protein QM042_01915 [Escherichia coli]|uniref:hypothetical protein n=1 Tax=Escherichia coli TaxID=562 RepID=UPI00398777F8
MVKYGRKFIERDASDISTYVQCLEELSSFPSNFHKKSVCIARGDLAVAKRLAKETAESQIEKVLGEIMDFAATFVKARHIPLTYIH